MSITEERLRILRANNEASHQEARTDIKEALITLLNKKEY